MVWIQQIIVSFIASATFGVIFNVARHYLVTCGFVGMVGWMIYLILFHVGVSSVPATLLAALCVTLLSQVFARAHKAPVIIFSAAGIVPLVPGGTAYGAMRYFVSNDYNQAIQLAAKAFMTSGAIAMGLMLAEVLYQLFWKLRRRTFRTY